MPDPAAPPPGFYDDPTNPGKQRWWDGSTWTDHTQDGNAPEGAGPRDGGVNNIVQQISEVVSDKLPDAQTAVGGALIADGLIGFGRNRVGIGGALGNLIVGIAFIVVFAFFVAPAMADQTAIGVPVSVEATVASVDRFQSENTDEQGRVTSTSMVCTVTLAYATQEGEEIRATTPYSSGSLCSRFTGEKVVITYDAEAPGRFEGLDSMSDGFTKWFPWVFVGVGVLMALSGLWTLILRATQIGGGVYLIARSRQKDRDKVIAKQAKKTAP